MAYAGKPKLSLMSISLGKTKPKGMMGNPPPPMGDDEEEGESTDAGALMAAEDLIEAVQKGSAEGVVAALKKCMEYC